MANDKRLKSLFRELESQGFRIRELKSGWMAVPPDKELPGVTIHKTLSDTRGWNNMLARLQRSGFNPKAK